jgi:hypothetical protein
MPDFNLFTNNVSTSEDESFTVTGTGIFDKMMESVTTHITAEFDRGSITGTERATVYLGALQSVLQTSAKIFLESQLADDQSAQVQAQTSLLGKQLLEVEAKTALIDSQKTTEDLKDELVQAQTLGFKTDAKQKLYAKQLETWAIYYSVAKSGSPPTSANTVSIDAMHADIISDLS